jgi:hypothetical protein
MLPTAIAACSSYPCPQDVTEDTMTGHVSAAGAVWGVPRDVGGRFGLSDLFDDHDNVLDIQIHTPVGDILSSFRRPATAGTSRFEDLVNQQWVCPPEAPYTQFGNPAPSCSGEAGVVQAQSLALTGTLEMTDDVVVNRDTWNLTATLHVASVTPPITIDLVVHTRHETIAHTCVHGPVNTQ